MHITQMTIHKTKEPAIHKTTDNVTKRQLLDKTKTPLCHAHAETSQSYFIKLGVLVEVFTAAESSNKMTFNKTLGYFETGTRT